MLPSAPRRTAQLQQYVMLCVLGQHILQSGEKKKDGKQKGNELLCARGKRVEMCPPSSWPPGRRLSAVDEKADPAGEKNGVRSEAVGIGQMMIPAQKKSEWMSGSWWATHHQIGRSLQARERAAAH